MGEGIEIPFVRTDTLEDGASFVASEAFFYAAMLAFALSALSGARRGLAGRSLTGRIGLVAIAVLAAIVAGIGILLGGPVPRPARAIFLVYGVAYTLAFFLISGADGPRYVVEFLQAAYWALIGFTVLKPGPRPWNIAAFVVAVLLGLAALAAVVVSQ